MEKEKIGKYIRKKRIEKGMTQQQLAEKIQVTEKAVSRWETGRGVPDISLLEPLAEELHVSVTELLNGEERVQEEAVHDTKAHMADIDITNVIEYVQENRKEKYNIGFKIGIGCLVVSLVLFLLYLREAYRFQGNYFGTMIRMTVISGIFLLGEMVLERCYLVKLEERRKRKKAVLAVLFIYYAVMLMNLTFLERTQTVTDYNIVPFRTIGTVLLSGNVYAIVINIFGNFFIFMPLQFFLIELFEIRKIKQNFLVCFTITFVIEIVQYIFKVGMLDVDDILLCVAGMMSFYYFYGKYRGKNKKRGM
jgi:hypothetical protein